MKCTTLFSNRTSQKRQRFIKKKIKSFLSVGDIYYKEESCNYMVQSLKDLRIIVDHFIKFPLLTQKRADFELFLQIFNLMKKKSI